MLLWHNSSKPCDDRPTNSVQRVSVAASCSVHFPPRLWRNNELKQYKHLHVSEESRFRPDRRHALHGAGIPLSGVRQALPQPAQPATSRLDHAQHDPERPGRGDRRQSRLRALRKAAQVGGQVRTGVFLATLFPLQPSAVVWFPVWSEISDFTPCAHAQSDIPHIKYAEKTDD